MGTMRAIDLYAGVGGWSLGLRLAGIEVVGSYEWWHPAVATHNKNPGGKPRATAVRELKLNELPTAIDVVVGSPPCTEFSYANRGGNGDLPEGMKDLARFFEIVRHLEPKWWAMENVPRVATVLRDARSDAEHALHEYRDLFPDVEIVDFSDFGTPQVRRRCIAGKYARKLLLSYKRKLPVPTLGEVVKALNGEGQVTDPTWGITVDGQEVTEREIEHCLSDEELRMNQDAKSYHPVYNDMAFPDDLERASRTVTATCTRVSRESIIIRDPRPDGGLRRLSIRERAALQGFPITYQFYSGSFGGKAKLVGNAIPPTFTYLLGMAVQETPVAEICAFPSSGDLLRLPAELPPVTKAEGRGKTYPRTRTFRAALPGLRFKSGMRFELANAADVRREFITWKIRFFYGASKNFRRVEPNALLVGDFRARFPDLALHFDSLAPDLAALSERLETSSPTNLQANWSRHARGDLSPYEVSDALGRIAQALSVALTQRFPEHNERLAAYVVEKAATVPGQEKFVGKRKLEHHAIKVLSGFLVGAWFNDLAWHRGFNRLASAKRTSVHTPAAPKELLPVAKPGR